MLPALLVIAGLSSWWLIQSEEPRSDVEQTPAQHSSLATADQPSVTTDGTSIESTQVLRNTESASATTSAAPEAEPPATQSAPGLHLGNTANSSDNSQQDAENLPENTEPEEAPRMSQATFSVIQQVQDQQLNGQWLASLEEMNGLYNNFEQLNSLEQVTLLNFYTNALIQLKMWQEAISAFTLMLTVPDLRIDLNARTLIALGQLHSRENEPEAARAYLEEWLIMHGDQPEYADQQARVEELLSEL
ncbi:hypothetical protein [Pseudohongiella nitratireducens]|uniref:hypothetical protein n=1 Tax=Pseudohongiella nitratireducens TaxID=1768907 RepID=UPI0030EEA593|tara:strand:- start:3474 stop:4214 length:741 start_codon:yes stop_codon:yes gene_type:complete